MIHFRVLLFALALLCSLGPITGRKGFSGGRHSYPKSPGLSGGGSHGYPSSSGRLSGGGSHGYPSSSGGLSGGGSHGYPSSSGGLSGGGSHGYPSSSGGLSGGGSHGYPPSSGGLSGGGRGYPTSGSGSSNHGYPVSGKTPTGGHTTVNNVYHNYHYNPPPQIHYTPLRGGAPVSYPVYHGTPPTYVYQYRDSGSKYGTLLTGLALLNLGALAGTAYAVSHNSGSGSSSSYKPQPGEICKFGIRKDNGDVEETRIDCQLITSFILQEQARTQNNPTNAITTTVTNVTIVNITNGVSEPVAAQPNPTYTMFPNGTLVPVNVTMNATGGSANNTMTSSVTTSVTTTTTNTTNALDVKGSPIKVTPGMECYVKRHTPYSDMKKSVDCGLLQTYAEKSISRKNSAIRHAPVFTALAVIFSFLMY